VRVHTCSPGMVLTDLLMGSAAGAADKRALHIFNILAERPETTAAWLVPRMRAATALPSGEYIRFLDGPGVVWRFATSPWRRNRLIQVQ
jgi:chlorophyll(ide) b reductase